MIQMVTTATYPPKDQRISVNWILSLFRLSGYDPDGHNCYLSSIRPEDISQLDIVFEASSSQPHLSLQLKPHLLLKHHKVFFYLG